MRKIYERKNPIDRFWAKVNKNGPMCEALGTKCWIWTGWKFAETGYGGFDIQFKKNLAHRYSYEISIGEIPEGLNVCHKCDNPPCIRPDHFFLGTDTDNMQDATRKGRLPKGDQHYLRLHPEKILRGDQNGARKHPEKMSRGEKNGSAKLTWNQVREIRKDYATKQYSQRELGKLFKVDHSIIGGIVNLKSWKEENLNV